MDARSQRSAISVGLVREALLDSYETLFSEAGIGLAASRSPLPPSMRRFDLERRARFAALSSCPMSADALKSMARAQRGRLYSAEFTLARRSARWHLARAELRLDARLHGANADGGTAPARCVRTPECLAARLRRGAGRLRAVWSPGSPICCRPNGALRTRASSICCPSCSVACCSMASDRGFRGHSRPWNSAIIWRPERRNPQAGTRRRSARRHWRARTGGSRERSPLSMNSGGGRRPISTC